MQRYYHTFKKCPRSINISIRVNEVKLKTFKKEKHSPTLIHIFIILGKLLLPNLIISMVLTLYRVPGSHG